MGVAFEYIVYSITTRCNINCPGCFRIGSGSVDLTLPIFIKSLPLLKEIGCNYLNLSGGEPLLHPEWRNFVKLSKKQGIIPMLSTNGILLEDMSEPILRDLAVLAIPLDGDTALVNDKVRGVGHFEKVTSLILEYVRGKFPFILKVNTVVNRNNYLRLNNILKVFTNSERIIWKLFQFTSRGNFSMQEENLSISTEDFREIVGKIKKTRDIKCKVTFLAADGASNYLIVSPKGDLFVPIVRSYRKICNLINDDAKRFIEKDQNLKGNSFSQVVLGGG